MGILVEPSVGFVSLALELLVKTALLMLLAEGVSRALRRAPAASRHLAWTVAVLAALILPVLILAGPRIGLPGVGLTPPPAPSVTTPATRPGTAPASRASGAAAPAVDVGAPDADTAAAPAPGAPLSGRALLTVLWLCGGAALLGRLLVGSVGAWHLVHRATPADPSWEPVYEEATTALGLRQKVRVLRSERADVPMVWGVLRPAVVLPADADRWSPHRRRLVLVHELAHVRRRDCLVQLFAHLATAVYWLNPLSWRAASRLRAERELACDDLVLRTGARGSEYAKHLLDIARDARGFRPGYGVALPMARPSQLEGRLLAILDSHRTGRRSARALRLVLPLVFSVVLVSVAVVDPWSPRPVAAEPELPPVPAPELQHTISTQLDPEFLAGVTAGLGAELAEQVQSALTRIASRAMSSGGRLQEPAPAGSDTRARVLEAMRRALSAADAGMRSDAAHALGMMEDAAAIPDLVAALGDEEAQVRAQAAWALGMIESPAAVAGLATAVQDDDPGVREQVAWALGMIESEEAVEPASRLLADPVAGVRAQAAWALGMIESTSGVTPLVRTLLDDDDGDVRAQAAWALGMIESPEAVPGLLEALASGDKRLQLQAIWALGMIEDESALDGLLDLMENGEPEVQRAAMQAIAQITG